MLPVEEEKKTIGVGGEALLLTQEGYRTVEEIPEDTEVTVWSGLAWVRIRVSRARNFHTSYRVGLSDCTVLSCTKRHLWLVYRKGALKKCRTDELQIGDEIIPPQPANIAPASAPSSPESVDLGRSCARESRRRRRFLGSPDRRASIQKIEAQEVPGFIKGWASATDGMLISDSKHAASLKQLLAKIGIGGVLVSKEPNGFCRLRIPARSRQSITDDATYDMMFADIETIPNVNVTEIQSDGPFRPYYIVLAPGEEAATVMVSGVLANASATCSSPPPSPTEESERESYSSPASLYMLRAPAPEVFVSTV